MSELATPIVGIIVYNAVRFWFNFSHAVNIYLLLATMQEKTLVLLVNL